MHYKQTHCLCLSLCTLCKRRDSPWRGSHACAPDGNVRNKTHQITHLPTSDSHVSHCEYYTDDIHVLNREDSGATVPPPSPLRARPVSWDPHRKRRRSEADRPTRPATWFLLLVQTVDQDPARLGSARLCSALLCSALFCSGTGPAATCRCVWGELELRTDDVLRCHVRISCHVKYFCHMREKEAWRGSWLVICEIPISIQLIP